jgi:hypothetical protein
MSRDVLEQLNLVTFSTGAEMVREVLDDWEEFLGGRPRGVRFAVSPAFGAPSIYEELEREGRIDELLRIDPAGRSVGEVDAEALRRVVEASDSEWVLLVKLDTLPYRQGHEGWLADAFERIERHQLFGLTGSFRSLDLTPLEPGYCTTRKYSNNFSIFRRDEWLEVIESSVGRNFDGPMGHSRYPDALLRFANEVAIETHLRDRNRPMLLRWESPAWSVFHVNVWGETLRRVREDYRARKNIAPFLNSGTPLPRRLRHPWEHYYGYPPPPWSKRVRIKFGEWRRDVFRRPATGVGEQSR